MVIDLKLVFAIVIAVHGIGHSLGVMTIPLGVIKGNGFSSNSWLLSDRLGLPDGVVKAVGYLWLVVAIGFIAASLGYWQSLDWWRQVAWASLALSLGLFVVWWNAFPSNIPIQANLGNVATLVALLWSFNA